MQLLLPLALQLEGLDLSAAPQSTEVSVPGPPPSSASALLRVLQRLYAGCDVPLVLLEVVAVAGQVLFTDDGQLCGVIWSPSLLTQCSCNTEGKEDSWRKIVGADV